MRRKKIEVFETNLLKKIIENVCNVNSKIKSDSNDSNANH